MRKCMGKIIALALVGYFSIGMLSPDNLYARNTDISDKNNNYQDNCTNPGDAETGTNLNGSNGLPSGTDFEAKDTEPDKVNTGNNADDDDGDDADEVEREENFIFRGDRPRPCSGMSEVSQLSEIDQTVLSKIPNINPGNKVCAESRGFVTTVTGNTKADIEKYTWTAWIKEKETDRADFTKNRGTYHGFGSDWIAIWKPYEQQIRELNNGKFPEYRDYYYPVDTKDGKLSFWVHKAGFYDVLGDPMYKKIQLHGYQTFHYIVEDIVHEQNGPVCGYHEESYTWCKTTSNASGTKTEDCHTSTYEVANTCDVYYYYDEIQSTKVAEATVAENMYATQIGKLPVFGLEVNEGANTKTCFTDKELFDKFVDKNGGKDNFNISYGAKEGESFCGMEFCVQSKDDLYVYTDKGTEGTKNVYQTLQIKDGLYTNMANGYICIPNEDGNCIEPEGPVSPDGGNGGNGGGNNGNDKDECVGDDCEEGTDITELLPPAIEIEIDIEKGNPQKSVNNVKKFVHLNKNVKNRLQFDYYRDKANRTESKNN